MSSLFSCQCLNIVGGAGGAARGIVVTADLEVVCGQLIHGVNKGLSVHLLMTGSSSGNCQSRTVHQHGDGS